MIRTTLEPVHCIGEVRSHRRRHFTSITNVNVVTRIVPDFLKYVHLSHLTDRIQSTSFVNAIILMTTTTYLLVTVTGNLT